MTVFEHLEASGVVPVIVIDRAEDAGPLGEALIAGGLRCAEVTFRTEAAPRAIETLSGRFPEMVVGAGTVLDVDQAKAAVDAGSRFIVSPGHDPVVVEWCLANEIPMAPGVMTATDITLAMTRGLRLMKFFPAEAAGGIATLTAMAGPFPEVRFMPTGGIGAHNLADYLRLPMVAACGGSWLASRRLIAEGEFGRITQLTAEAVDIVSAVRGGG